MSHSTTIENLSIAAIKICVSGIETVTLIPGFNFLSDYHYQKLVEHPAFAQKIEAGILRQASLKEELKHDDRTNLPYVEKHGEQVPVSNALINGSSSPVLENGIRFKLSELIDAGIEPNLAGRIHKFTPSEGWTDAEHVISATETNKDQDKIRALFER